MFSDDDEAIGDLEDMAMETEPPEIKQVILHSYSLKPGFYKSVLLNEYASETSVSLGYTCISKVL